MTEEEQEYLRLETEGVITGYAKLRIVMAQAYEAFCTLSNAQELLSMGRPDAANNMINHAKLHLRAGFDTDRDTHHLAVGDMPIECTLPPELSKIAEERGWL